MTNTTRTDPAANERLRPLALEEMNEAQRAAADALIRGPRKGVKGPFIALLRSPELLDRVAQLGEQLRFRSVLEQRINEFVTMIVARALTNQFEWATHQPLALKAGISVAACDALAEGRRPTGLAADEAIAYDFTLELLHTHGVCDTTYRAAADEFGEQGVVELTTLIGYFVLVSWVLNVAHTGAPAETSIAPLAPFPG